MKSEWSMMRGTTAVAKSSRAGQDGRDVNPGSNSIVIKTLKKLLIFFVS